MAAGRVAPAGAPSQREAPNLRDTRADLAATSLNVEDATVLKKARIKANEIVATSVGLYREMALSALRLVPGRR